MGHTFMSSELYLCGASTKEPSAAFWIAMNQGVPAGNVTGDWDVAHGGQAIVSQSWS